MRARPSLRANGSRECAPDRHCERSEAIQSRKKSWIASALTLLAMTGPGTGARSFETVIASQWVARMRARPSLRAKRSNPSRRTKKGWIASSLTLLAMTGPDTGARSFETVIASQRVARMRARASLRAKRSNPEPQERLDCFVADAPRNDGTDTGARSFETVSQRVARMRARPSLRAKRSNPEPQERLDCFVADAPRNDGTDTGARSFETVSQF